ncbi:MAG: FAD-binding oxidoreductase, partial [Candidatus Binatia bacterium]
VLGMTAIDGCGRTLHAGGRVVKNVAGYDLVRLLTGSWGGLAVITELTLRTHPLPSAAATLVFEFVSAAELDAARARLLAEPLPLAAIDFAVDATGSTTFWILVVRVEGTGEEVADQGDRVCAAVGREPSDAVEDWESPAHVDSEGGMTLKIATAPADIVGTVRGALSKLKDSGARRSGASLRVAGHLGAGVARFHIGAEDSEDENSRYAAFASLLTATSARDLVRTRVIERAPAAIKTTHDVWGSAPAAIALMRSIKQRLDPDDVLSPGRFVGGL